MKSEISELSFKFKWTLQTLELTFPIQGPLALCGFEHLKCSLSEPGCAENVRNTLNSKD